MIKLDCYRYSCKCSMNLSKDYNSISFIVYVLRSRNSYRIFSCYKRQYTKSNTNCNNNQKQTIRAFLEEKLVNTIQNLSKIKKSFLTVFDSANKTTVKHNPKELRKREPKELQKREPKKLKKSKSKGKGSGWSSDFEKRNIKS